MLKKRVIVLFFILSTICLFGDTKESVSDKAFIDKGYEAAPKVFFATGKVITNEKEFPITIYREKNKNNFYNLSIKMDNDIYKITSGELETIFNLNNVELSGDVLLKNSNIPLDILNYSLRNMDYNVLSKSRSFKYLEIPTNKILIKEKKIIKKVTPTVLDMEPRDLDANNIEPRFVEESNKDVESINFLPEKYKKVIYYQGELPSISLKKEFYLNKSDIEPQYVVEVTRIVFINGNYIIANWEITDKKSKKVTTFHLNIDSVIFNKQDIPRDFKSLLYFKG
ncbi:MAG: hypothetical protein B6229_00900 [Spirochaetaceae bacterium 4572_7]|nr:MAG: hypothetical protein B6229_00900 [Spirochaetaceae bacterium 4572_7]